MKNERPICIKITFTGGDINVFLDVEDVKVNNLGDLFIYSHHNKKATVIRNGKWLTWEKI